MKIRLLSDLHLEFEKDQGVAFINSLDPGDSDVLVLAGDITVCNLVCPTLRKLTAKWPYVIYLCGNHEFYGTDIAVFKRRVLREMLPNNLMWFGVQGYQILHQEVAFAGATLWFPRRERSWHHRKSISDFSLIEHADEQIPIAHQEDVRQLRRFSPDVVVTHHLPCTASVSPRYRGSLLNDFFEADQEALVRELHPKLWLHGHTHDSVDVMVGETRVVCNPRGYWPDSLNPNFDPNYTLVL